MEIQQLVNLLANKLWCSHLDRYILGHHGVR